MNILLIMADQLPAAALGAYGHPVVKSPHIDRLANEGTLFENCYCNNPLCVPSRASMVTGRLTCRIDSFDNGSELPAAVPTFMHYLRRGGYRTILSGKMHFIGPDQLHGFQERLTTDIYPAGFNWTPDWRLGIYPNPGTSVVQLKDTGLCKWNLQLDYDEEVHFRALECLRLLARRSDGRPFFLCASYTHPHDPFLTTRKYWDLYPDGQIDMPAAPARPVEAMHPFNQWLQVHHEADRYPPTDDDVRRTRHAFYGEVSYFDEKVGGLLAELDQLGLAEDTAVIVLSDHGEMMGEHGMWFKRTFHEWSSHVPLIVRTPGAPAGQRVREAVSLVDVFPTLLDLAALPRPDTPIDGQSVAPAVQGGPCHDHAMVEYYGEGVVQPMRALRRGKHKYVYVHEHEPLLFDVDSDPTEQHNLAGRPELAALEESLRADTLRDWDPDAMARRVMQSQQERLMIREALTKGTIGEVGRSAPDQTWHFQAHFDDSQRYVREHDAQDTNARAMLK